MFFRLMLLIPFLRSILLLDVSMMSDGTEPEEPRPSYDKLDRLAMLHAQALMHMHEHGWPLGSLHSIPAEIAWIQAPYGSGWYQQKLEEHFGISTPDGLLIMRSGAIYGLKKKVAGKAVPHKMLDLIDPALVDDETQRKLTHAFEDILTYKPEPVYVID